MPRCLCMQAAPHSQLLLALHVDGEKRRGAPPQLNVSVWQRPHQAAHLSVSSLSVFDGLVCRWGGAEFTAKKQAGSGIQCKPGCTSIRP